MTSEYHSNDARSILSESGVSIPNYGNNQSLTKFGSYFPLFIMREYICQSNFTLKIFYNSTVFFVITLGHYVNLFNQDLQKTIL